MKAIVDTVTKNIKLKVKRNHIDNLAFKLHYRVTMLLLFILTVLVTSQELIGEHIKCLVGSGVNERVINTFCFFTTTFTVIKYLNTSFTDSHYIPHPGVGSMGVNSDEPIIHHAYYQWVPFVLFLQAITFYIPHLIWKRKEAGRIKKLVNGLEFAVCAVDNKIKLDKYELPTKTDIKKKFEELNIMFKDRLIVNKSWATWLITCEVLNLINVILQIWLTDVFLGGKFLSLGPKVIEVGMDEVWILDQVFPKMTKCNFYKYGASGTIQAHDALCVMALNIINEKIFTFLWFWFMFLLVVSAFALLWRLVTAVFHGKNRRFNQIIYSTITPGKSNPWKVLEVTNKCDYLDWLFLGYISKNMDPLVFKIFIVQLAKNLSQIDDNTISAESYEKGMDSLKPNYFNEQNFGSIDKIDEIFK
ncbi:PREDICTED: innexin inx7-like [Nicrophorus vespilloides]|uniref:Innexin n=1 Tax=Nicrophorus vespilloides TaxID=110193 RepID=A0ABM1NCI7_NICVS|nr:PREDICTED: innexin inx7-like [Nicrophorus vespilloides]